MNERIRGLNAEFGIVTGSYEVLCECGRDDCVQRIEVPAPVFEEIRSVDGRFLVRSGHEDNERVLAVRGTYSVVALA